MICIMKVPPKEKKNLAKGHIPLNHGLFCCHVGLCFLAKANRFPLWYNKNTLSYRNLELAVESLIRTFCRLNSTLILYLTRQA